MEGDHFVALVTAGKVEEAAFKGKGYTISDTFGMLDNVRDALPTFIERYRAKWHKNRPLEQSGTKTDASGTAASQRALAAAKDIKDIEDIFKKRKVELPAAGRQYEENLRLQFKSMVESFGKEIEEFESADPTASYWYDFYSGYLNKGVLPSGAQGDNVQVVLEGRAKVTNNMQNTMPSIMNNGITNMPMDPASMIVPGMNPMDPMSMNPMTERLAEEFLKRGYESFDPEDAVAESIDRAISDLSDLFGGFELLENLSYDPVDGVFKEGVLDSSVSGALQRGSVQDRTFKLDREQLKKSGKTASDIYSIVRAKLGSEHLLRQMIHTENQKISKALSGCTFSGDLFYDTSTSKILEKDDDAVADPEAHGNIVSVIKSGTYVADPEELFVQAKETSMSLFSIQFMFAEIGRLLKLRCSKEEIGEPSDASSGAPPAHAAGATSNTTPQPAPTASATNGLGDASNADSKTAGIKSSFPYL